MRKKSCSETKDQNSIKQGEDFTRLTIIGDTIKDVNETWSGNSHFSRMRKFPGTDIRPIRVLFIVDSLHWVIGNFAHQITKHNPEIHAVTCSQFAIRKTIKRFGEFPTCFDIVHCLRTKTIPEFFNSLPIVTTLHHFDAATDLAPFYHSDAVMTVSTQWQQYLAQRGIAETHQAIVPFGVDTNTFFPPQGGTRLKIRKTLNFPKDAFVLGFSSRQISNTGDRKGVTYFLQALQTLRQQLPNLATLIIGPGWQALAKEIRQRGIPCTQAPYEEIHEEVAKFYSAMDLFWVTSRIEGGPVPLLEAMASSIPCISTPVGAALDLIENNKNGFIVPFNSPELFVHRSLQLSQDETLRSAIGNEARKTIIKKRQWRHVGRELQELYRIAITNFQSRAKHSYTQGENYKKTERKNQKSSSQEPMTEDVFFSRKVQNSIHACEQINGLRLMTEMREWKTVCLFGLRALRTTPFDPYLWKELISALIKRNKPSVQQTKRDKAPRQLTPEQRL